MICVELFLFDLYFITWSTTWSSSIHKYPEVVYHRDDCPTINKMPMANHVPKVHVHPFSRRQWCYLMLFRNVWGYCGLGISCVVVWPQLVVPLQTGWFITKWIHMIQLEWAVRIFLKNCWQQVLLIHVDSFCRELVVQWFLHCLIYSWNMWSAQIVRWNSSSSWTWQK
jgi:hypothetical protein